jgi:zinc protease
MRFLERMPRRFLLRAAAVLLAAALPAAAVAAAFAADTPIPTGPQVKVGKLPNGLTYYIQRNATPAGHLELRLAVRAGSLLEDDDQRGLAHFVEHMAFNGSTHFRKHELVSWLRSIGMNYGNDLNAVTGYDDTTYRLAVPTARPEAVDQAFTVLEDWAHGIRFDDADIDDERRVVLEELRLHKSLAERMAVLTWPKLFNGSRYPLRNPIGKEDVLRHAGADQLRRFYRDWYRPDLMAVVVVGDIDPLDAERRIVASFGGLRNPERERERVYDDIHALPGTDALVVTDPEQMADLVELHYPVRFAPQRGTYGDYREKRIQELFVRMLVQRLEELVQQADPPFAAAGVRFDRRTPRHQAYVANAWLGAGGSAPALAALLQEHERIRQYGFSSDELERARGGMLARFEGLYLARNATASATYAAEYLRNFLAGESLPGMEAEYRMLHEVVPAIGLEEINAFARQAVPAGADKLAIFYGAGHRDAPAPTRERLLADIAAGEHAQVAPRTETALASSLMEPPSAPGGIVAESEDKALGLTYLTLSNGIKVVLKPNRGQNVFMLWAQRYGGLSLFSEKDQPSARYATALAESMGLKDWAPLALRKVLPYGPTVGLSMNLSGEEINGRSSNDPRDIESMLQQLWLRFAGVRRDEGLYRSYMSRETAFLRNRDASLDARLDDALADAAYGKHPYEPRANRPEDLGGVDLDRSIALYRQRFSSARGFTFVLVGNFDVARLKLELARYLGTLPTPDLPLGYRDVGLGPARGVIKREVPGGTEQKSVVALSFSGPATISPVELRRFGVLNQLMTLRIKEVLREKLGLIYDGWMTGSLSILPSPTYTITTRLPTGPENVDRLTAALFAEIERMRRDGPDAADLAKVRAAMHQTYQRVHEDSDFWMGVLKNAQVLGAAPGELLRMADSGDEVTVDDIRQAARRYFDTGNYVQVVLNPQAPKPELPKPALAGALTPRLAPR